MLLMRCAGGAKVSRKSVVKNCYNCIHLEWVDTGSEYHANSEPYCDGRQYKNDYEEKKHLAMLKNETYLKKGKSCCVLKTDEVENGN